MGRPYDYEYENCLSRTLAAGRKKEDRTGTGTLSVFGERMRFDLRNGSLPIVTTKKVYMPAVIHELLWFLMGETNIKYLKENGIKIWDEWADENGDLGPVYGSQWRSWRGAGASHTDSDVLNSTVVVDQIANVMVSLATNPDSRRHIVSAWNPAEIDQMKLPPCHALFQFYTEEMTLQERYYMLKPSEASEVDMKINARPGPATHEDLDTCSVPRRYLSCQLYQRSADEFLGAPFNIASYALLTHMVAHQLGYEAREFVWTGGDCHIYLNHLEQVKEQLSRTGFDYPTVEFATKPASIFDYKYDDIKIVNYQHQPAIKAPVAV